MRASTESKSASRRLLVALGMLSALVAALTMMISSARANETVISCGPYSNSGVFVPINSPPVTATPSCPGIGYGGTGHALYLSANGPAVRGQNALLQANAPPGLTIVGVTASGMGSGGVNAGTQGQYGGDFYWDNGASNITPGETSFGTTMGSTTFGVQLVCGLTHCAPTNIDSSTWIIIQQIALYVAETSPPTLSAPSGLWQAPGWVRGTWPLSIGGDSPSGLCGISVNLAGQSLPGSLSAGNQATWHQCAAPPVQDTVNTVGYAQGANALAAAAWDAAGETTAASKTIYVDNQQPTIALSGPAEAASTSGTQYVIAQAAAGPSGVAGISCSVDSAPARWFAASTAQIPVAGIGHHQVQCFSENNAVDGNGVHGTSAAGSFTTQIGIPTVSAVTFSKLLDPLRCRRIAERVTVPARWRTVKRGRRQIRVLRPAHVKIVKVTRCHARVIRQRRTVLVTVRRHGKRVLVKRTKTVRVVVLPHVVSDPTQRVRFGKAATVSGWLGTYNGQAVPGQAIQVLAAPDNGSGAFAPVATATTNATGAWTAEVPPGPSRLIAASFPGGADLLATQSTAVKEVVPARLRLTRVTPRRVAWGGTVRLVGQLDGGYLPAGGALVRLRIGQGSAVSTYGVREHVLGNGRFATTYTFGAGDPAAFRSFWFQLSSLPMGDYPYAPASSRRITVVVGGNPPPPPARHNRHGQSHRLHRSR